MTIRLRPLLAGALLFLGSILALYCWSDALIRLLPGSAVGELDVMVSWRVLRREAQLDSGNPGVYVLGGSQVMYGFPEQGVATDSLDVWTCGMSSPTLMDSFLILTHLPVDKNTYVFLHTSPSRMSKTTLAVPSRLGFLDSGTLVQAFRSQGIDLPQPDDRARWARQFKTLVMSMHNRLDSFPNEKWYGRDPVGFAAAADPRRQAGERGGSAEGRLADPGLILDVMRKYVESRGGHLYLIELPYYLAFPKGMAGWRLEDQPDPHVREWLEEMYRTRNYASGQLTGSYYAEVGKTGIPLISFNDQSAYGPNDFFDSMHLTASGRAKLLPLFLQAVEREVERGGAAFQ